MTVELEPTYFREWRKYRGLTLAQVADHIGIDSTAVSRLERGASPYDQTHLQQLSALYDCTIPELLYSDPRRPRAVDALLKKAERLSNPADIQAVVRLVEAILARPT